jgi:hypothetical protein
MKDRVEDGLHHKPGIRHPFKKHVQADPKHHTANRKRRNPHKKRLE